MNATVRKDLYAQVTESIVAMMEEGMTRHIQWVRTGHGLPCHHQTGIPYQGVNVLLLWAEAMRQGYVASRWLTYKQATAMGGQVRKGEKSVQCVFFGTVAREARNGRGQRGNAKRARHSPLLAVQPRSDRRHRGSAANPAV